MFSIGCWPRLEVLEEASKIKFGLNHHWSFIRHVPQYLIDCSSRLGVLKLKEILKKPILLDW